MKNVRNLLCVLMALMLAAFALPGMADGNRTFSLAMCVGSWSANLSTTAPQFSCTPSPGVLSAKIKNTTTANVGGATSATLFVDTGWNIVSVSNIQEDGVPVRATPIVSTPGQFSVADLPPLKPGASLTMDFQVSAASCGDGTWSAGVWTGTPPPSGQPFSEDQDPLSQLQTSVSCGLLQCPTPQFTVKRPDTQLQAGTVVGQVWSPDKIGQCLATAENYWVTNDLIKSSQPVPFWHFRFNDEFAVVSYTINFPTAPNPAKVGWLKCGSGGAVYDGTDPSQVTGCTITPPSCLSPTPPGRYATLAATVKPTDTTVQVNYLVSFSKQLPKTPFPIEIVNDDFGGAERMLVTKATGGGTLTVTRCDGRTCTNPPQHTFSSTTTKYVVGTMLPTLLTDYQGNTYNFSSDPNSPQYVQWSAGYRNGMQAQMCLVLPLVGQTPDPSAPGTFYYPFTFYDIGDGWGSP